MKDQHATWITLQVKIETKPNVKIQDILFLSLTSMLLSESSEFSGATLSTRERGSGPSSHPRCSSHMHCPRLLEDNVAVAKWIIFSENLLRASGSLVPRSISPVGRPEANHPIALVTIK